MRCKFTHRECSKFKVEGGIHEPLEEFCALGEVAANACIEKFLMGEDS